MTDMFDLRQVPTGQEMSKKEGRAQLEELQNQLLRYQQATYKHGHRIVLVFEGADASGKGGAIKRLTQVLDPRGFRVYPIGPPSTEELGQHYLQRFWRCFPASGNLAIFDRFLVRPCAGGAGRPADSGEQLAKSLW